LALNSFVRFNVRVVKKAKEVYAIVTNATQAVISGRDTQRLVRVEIRSHDLIYAIAGKTVGIEITTIYCDDGQAAIEWKLLRGEIKREPPRLVVTGSWTEPDELFFARMQRELDDKCAKDYSGVETVWLCMKIDYGLATVREIDQMITSISVPAHRFGRIYLGLGAPINDGGGFRVFTLFEGSDR
jgi:hypothetical protein